MKKYKYKQKPNILKIPVNYLSYDKFLTVFLFKIYGKFFHGKVVDMFYFPIWSGNLPNWLPFVGGDFFTFFQYIFNPADAFISVSVAILFVFSKQAFPKK